MSSEKVLFENIIQMYNVRYFFRELNKTLKLDTNDDEQIKDLYNKIINYKMVKPIELSQYNKFISISNELVDKLKTKKLVNNEPLITNIEKITRTNSKYLKYKIKYLKLKNSLN